MLSGVIEGEKQAIEMLKTWDKSAMPADPFAIANSLGIRVEHTLLPRDVSGRIAVSTNKHPVITLNSHDDIHRQRFSCAHEIGHYINNADCLLFSFTDYRSTLAGISVNEEEVFANQFAAALLMPADIMAKYHRAGLIINEIALLLNTSKRAVALRLKNLQLL